MAKTTRRQRKTEGRVMHEFKHGELKRGRGGGKVKSRKQAIAIALNEAGASTKQRPAQKRKKRTKTARKEARGETGLRRQEGRFQIGARSRRKTAKSPTRKSGATRKTRTTRKSAGTRKTPKTTKRATPRKSIRRKTEK